MAAKSTSLAERRCLQCGAADQTERNRCWLCGAGIREAADDANRPSSPGTSAAPPELSQGFSLASLMMFVTLFSVVLGTITIAPGLGVPLAFVAFFTWINTVEVIRRRAAKGQSLTSGERALLFIQSFLSTIALLAMLGVAAVAALSTAVYASCALDYHDLSNKYVAYAFEAAFISAFAIFGFVKLVLYKRRRWRSEFGKTD